MSLTSVKVIRADGIDLLPQLIVFAWFKCISVDAASLTLQATAKMFEANPDLIKSYEKEVSKFIEGSPKTDIDGITHVLTVFSETIEQISYKERRITQFVNEVDLAGSNAVMIQKQQTMSKYKASNIANIAKKMAQYAKILDNARFNLNKALSENRDFRRKEFAKVETDLWETLANCSKKLHVWYEKLSDMGLEAKDGTLGSMILKVRAVNASENSPLGNPTAASADFGSFVESKDLQTRSSVGDSHSEKASSSHASEVQDTSEDKAATNPNMGRCATITGVITPDGRRPPSPFILPGARTESMASMTSMSVSRISMDVPTLRIEAPEDEEIPIQSRNRRFSYQEGGKYASPSQNVTSSRRVLTPIDSIPSITSSHSIKKSSSPEAQETVSINTSTQNQNNSIPEQDESNAHILDDESSGTGEAIVENSNQHSSNSSSVPSQEEPHIIAGFEPKESGPSAVHRPITASIPYAKELSQPRAYVYKSSTEIPNHLNDSDLTPRRRSSVSTSPKGSASSNNLQNQSSDELQTRNQKISRLLK